MLSTILQSLPSEFPGDMHAGVFLSAYDTSHELIISQGLVSSDQPLEDTITTLREDIFVGHSEQITAMSIDIVTDTTELHDLKTLGQYHPKQYGFVMIDTDDDLSGVILPETTGITDAKHALWSIKQKYGLHGRVEVIAFRTKRITLKK